MDDIMSSNDINIKDYLNEKFAEIKDSIKDLKGEFKENQSDLLKRIERIEDDLLFYRFALKYKKLFVGGCLCILLTAGYQIYQTVNKIIEHQTEMKHE